MKDLSKKLTKLQIPKNLRTAQNSFQDRFPKTYKLFSILKDGTKRFGAETLLFTRHKNNLAKNPRYVQSMTWKDVNIYRELPRDWKAVAPVMIIASIPFMNYIILPLAYIYPQKLLCKQFWTQNQIRQYGENKFNRRLLQTDSLLIRLRDEVELKLSNKDNYAKNYATDLIERVHSGRQVSLDEIIELKPILNRPEFNLNNLKQDHLQNLVNLHNCQRVFNWSHIRNLEYYAYWLNMEDKKLMKENLDKIENEYIWNFSYDRGINANKHSSKELAHYLRNWMKFSSQLGFTDSKSYQENNYTLYLHGMILLSKDCHSKMKMQEK